MSETKRWLVMMINKLTDIDTHLFNEKKDTIDKLKVINIYLGVQVSLIILVKELLTFYDDNITEKTQSELFKTFDSIIKQYEEYERM